MITLGLRLATAGGRRQVIALLLTAVAVAVGTAFLLLALSVEPAYAARAARSDILDPGTTQLSGSVPAGPYTAVRTGADAFRDQPITVVDLAGSGPGAPRPGGLELPRPGELLVSRALAELAAREPLLAQRYPASSGRLPDAVVRSPETLMAVRGADVAGVRVDRGWNLAPTFGEERRPRDLGPVFRLMIVIGSVAMLAPVVVFTATATRLTAAGRERRMAALRLAGATTGQVARLAVVEAALAGTAGAVAGLGLFFLVRPLATAVTIDEPWYVTDLTPSPAAFAVALVGVPLAAVLGALVALGRAAVSPVQVGRRARPRPLRIWRLVPLLAAVAAFVVAVRVPPLQDPSMIAVTFAALLAALLYAGPWLTRATGSALSRTASPAALLAGRRLTTDPRLGFRAVGGPVLGAFLVALFLTAAPALRTEVDPAAFSGLAPDAAVGWASDVTEARSAERVLAGVPGVTVTTVRTLFVDNGQLWVGDCAVLARVAGADPAACAPGRVLVAPGPSVLDQGVSVRGDPVTVRGTPVVALPATGLDRPAAVLPADAVGPLAPDSVVWSVAVLAAPDALERARTRLVQAGLSTELATAAVRTARFSAGSIKLERVLMGALLAAYGVAGCSVAVAAAAGLLERRRSFALLRLAGTPLAVLRRSAAVELAVPLLAASLVAAGLGILTGRLTGLAGDVDLPVPWATLGAPLALGVAIALALGSLALPLVPRMTAGQVTRFE